MAKVISRKLPADHPLFRGGPTMYTPIARPPMWSVVVSDNWEMYGDDDAPDAAGEFASPEAAIAACEARVDSSIAWIMKTSSGLDLSKGSDEVYDAWGDGGDSPGIRSPAGYPNVDWGASAYALRSAARLWLAWDDATIDSADGDRTG